MISRSLLSLFWLLTTLSFTGCKSNESVEDVIPSERIVIVGNNLSAMMMEYGYFETACHLAFPDRNLVIRNMSRSGNTLGFRPHSAREEQLAFRGADKYYDITRRVQGRGVYPSPDEWLLFAKPDIILNFFGHVESFKGDSYIDEFKDELYDYIAHFQELREEGLALKHIVFVSPTAYEKGVSEILDADIKTRNREIEEYSNAMKEICSSHNLEFVDLFHESLRWYEGSESNLTLDGFQLSENGYQLLSEYLVEQLFSIQVELESDTFQIVREAVLNKNWFWNNDFNMPNGIHVYGRRREPFGSKNYPPEIAKVRELTVNRDSAIWAVVKGEGYNLELADKRTTELPAIETSYESSADESVKYLYDDEAEESFETAEGFKIELFASEKDFPNLANPVRLSFDQQGRLWVATMPSYPHFKPGNDIPDDKLIILEDTDSDGRADKETVWASGLHMPLSFEIMPEGVFVSEQGKLLFLQDTDADDRFDSKEIVFSGFDNHDSHHAISTFTLDPLGSLYMAEGTFLHSYIETPYKTVVGTHGGFFRLNIRSQRLERISQVAVPNPWGLEFNRWGQPFYSETSTPSVFWLAPSEMQITSGRAAPKSVQLIDSSQMVRPTCGIEFISSRHFPPEYQGDFIINNTIGFVGAKQHNLIESATGYSSKYVQDLFWSNDQNFRPVDVQFAPDGSLYIADWHNVLIGHMQHSARDPLRDHAHGRIYRMTYPERPLVEPAIIDQAEVHDLLNNLKLPEYRTRYRTKKELWSRNRGEVESGIQIWVDGLDEAESEYEHHLLEAFWVLAGFGVTDELLAVRLMNSSDDRIRAAIVKASKDLNSDFAIWINELAAEDSAGRVRLEALINSTWLNFEITRLTKKSPSQRAPDPWLDPIWDYLLALGEGERKIEADMPEPSGNNLNSQSELMDLGESIYNQVGSCGTCHGKDGKGYPKSGFPPLSNSEWVKMSKKNLLKIILKGIRGEISVNNNNYPGSIAMQGFENTLSSKEVAAVANYVIHTFGENGRMITEQEVNKLQMLLKDRKKAYSASELLEGKDL